MELGAVVVELVRDKEDGARVTSLRRETARIKTLTAECRGAGIFLEDLPEELHRGRTLVQERRLDAALERMREIRLELLGRLLLKATEDVPPSGVEHTPPGTYPSPEALAAINARIDKILAAATGAKPRR